MLKTPKPEFILTHIIVAVIFLACLMMAGPMKGGLPVDGELESRLEYISSSIGIWKTGWFLWMTSALGLLLFATFLSSYLERSVFRTFGLTLIGLGIAPDLIAEVIYAFIIPQAYAASADLQMIAVYENLAVHLTGFLGNGLYNIGGLILNVLLWRQRLVADWIAGFGLIAWVLGIGLSISVALGSMTGAQILTGLSMALSTFWMLLIAHTLFKSDRCTAS